MFLCTVYGLTRTNNPAIKEVFVDFVHATLTTGKKTGEAITTLFVKHGLQVMNIRGQSYVGAAAMVSSKVGIQAQILAVNLLALYNHCTSHVLNLAVAAFCTIQAIRKMTDIINGLYVFFETSPKQQRCFELVTGVYAPKSGVHKV